ncbi:MAG: hypothetical protein K1X81_02390 [Bacteroidia bacterium]|nr:hypothetical protein [Bacteroidia bacterium]
MKFKLCRLSEHSEETVARWQNAGSNWHMFPRIDGMYHDRSTGQGSNGQTLRDAQSDGLLRKMCAAHSVMIILKRNG